MVHILIFFLIFLVFVLRKTDFSSLGQLPIGTLIDKYGPFSDVLFLDYVSNEIFLFNGKLAKLNYNLKLNWLVQ